MFLSLVLPDYRIPGCAQLLVMIVIAGSLSLLGLAYKPVSWCNMCTCSGNGTKERAVQDLLCLVDLYLVYLI